MPIRRAKATRVVAFALCLVGAGPLSADVVPSTAGASAVPSSTEPQAAAPAEAAAGKPSGPEMTSVQRDALVVELSTAGYYELAARARELGLPVTGEAEELRGSLYKYYGLEAPAAQKKGRVVTIERAGQASYAKVEEEEGGVVRASGGVILTLVEANGDIHRVEADSVAFDRARSSLTARGKVRYERKSGTTTDVFVGEALSANLDDWSGVFIDGKMRKAAGATAAAGTPGGTTTGDRGLVIAAETIVSRSTDIMVLQNGVISSSEADDPHYAIRAKHVWILGDKELAFSNAVFSLGNVPILWLPFFYYPGDDIIFHPVIGYRTREGTFIQTTTYLIGQKPPATQTTSLLSMTQEGPAQPTEVKGLFLRKVSGTPPKDTGSLKTILDLYSSLGGFAGLQASFPKLSFLDKTDLFTGVGLSRSLFAEENGASYSPYDAAGNWQSVWNSSDFLNFSFPLRYAFDLSTSLKLGGFSASLALPLYSDPYIDQDFRNRSEDMDWFKLLSATTDTTVAPALRTQLVPALNLALSIKPKGLDPFLQSIEISQLGTSMTFLTKTDSTLDNGNTALYQVDPRYQFFYPSLFRPIDATASFRGSFFGAQAQAPEKKIATEGTGASLELRDPWKESEDESSNGKAKGDEAAAPDSAAAAPDSAAAPDAAASPDTTAAPAVSGTGFRLPSSVPSATAAKAAALTGSATWTLTPSVYYEDRYRSDWIEVDPNTGNSTSYQWTNPSQIDFSSLLYGLLSYHIASSIDMSAAYGDYLNSTLSLTYADQAQNRLIDTADPTTQDSYNLADNLYRSRSFGESAKLTFKPFASSWLWNATTIGWGLDSTIYGLKYDTSQATATTPGVLTENWLSWDPSSITAHNVSLNLAARPLSLPQSLSIVANLPPTLESYSAQLSLSAGFATFNVQTRMYKKIEGADFSFDPFSAALTIGNAPGPSLSDNAVYDQTGTGWVSNTAGLTWGPFNTTLTQKQTSQYTLTIDQGWTARTDVGQIFAPTDLAVSLAPQFKYPADTATQTSSTQWSLAPSLSLAQSLVRFSESSLTFGLTASLKIGDILNLSLSSSSENDSAWQYYAGLFSSQISQVRSSTGALGGLNAADYQVNPLADIWDGLSVWNPDALKRSLFKLKSLSFTIAHDLQDWTLSGTVSTSPLLLTTNTYTLDTKISILLAWKDMSQIKSTINYDNNPIPPLTSITY